MKIGIFGRTNAGKSTLLNALTAQNVAIVAPEAGTTTDPVRRAYELLGVGKVTFIDTAGFDDTTSLGAQRLKKTVAVIDEIDVALFLTTSPNLDPQEQAFVDRLDCPMLHVVRGYDPALVLQRIVSLIEQSEGVRPSFYGDLLPRGGVVLLVCPIDSEAPEGRLILPQVQAVRAALDLNGVAIVVQVGELRGAMERWAPDLVVTDSQAFGEVQLIVGDRVPLTSFSILLARQKGDPELYRRGLEALGELEEGSCVLLIEHCSHGVSCQDIARVKIPALIERRLGFMPRFDIVSGRDPLPDDLGVYSLAVQCGGCMTSARPIGRRIELCRRVGLPITNYGMLLRELQR